MTPEALHWPPSERASKPESSPLLRRTLELADGFAHALTFVCSYCAQKCFLVESSPHCLALFLFSSQIILYMGKKRAREAAQKGLPLESAPNSFTPAQLASSLQPSPDNKVTELAGSSSVIKYFSTDLFAFYIPNDIRPAAA